MRAGGYTLQPYDAIYVPEGTAHSVNNPSIDATAQLHTAFPTDSVVRQFVEESFPLVERTEPDASCPEHLTRFERAGKYELAPNTKFCDLFARRLGSRGICGGYGWFAPGASLPCHRHVYDESITIVTGLAVCQVAGREYELSNFDTACIPTGRPHRFINRSDANMAMIWIYAGDEPDRVVLDQGYCDGRLPFSEPDEYGEIEKSS